MRTLVTLTLAAAVASCTTAPPPPLAPDPRAQARLNELLAGKVAGAPQTCLPNWRTHDMVSIDDNTIVFRQGGSRVWVQKTQSPCARLGNPSYALVTRSGLNQLCQGDIAQVVDPVANMAVGSCVLGPFVPYSRVGS